jgi:hypothetical protein
MKTTICFIPLFFSFCSEIFSQSILLDSIFTREGLILANVKSVEPEVINYAYPNEEVVTSIYKNTVQKIRFKSGRVQMFTEALALKNVNSAYDFDQVNVTRLEGETKGLIKLDEVFTKAVGTTVFSNITQVKERAFRKMKIQAAMLGGNLVYMLDQSTVGNQVGSQYQSGKATETILSGIVYTNTLPKLDDIKKFIGNKKYLQSYVYISIGQNSTEIDNVSEVMPLFTLEEIYEDRGFIYLKARAKNVDNQVFRVSFADKDKIGIVWKDGKRIYNIYFNSEQGVEGK